MDADTNQFGNAVALPLSSFNDGGVLDLAFSAEDLQTLNTTFWEDGIVPHEPDDNSNDTSGKVIPNSGLTVQISAGRVHIDGTVCFWPNLLSSEFAVDPPDLMERIDSVVVRRDFAARRADVMILRGAPASAPVAPLLSYEKSGVAYFRLADISVKPAVSEIKAADITDRRVFIKIRLGETNNLAVYSARKLATARKIALSGKVTGTPTAFDGTADISIPVTAVTADSCTGNAATATKLATARTITMDDNSTAGASFDGSANAAVGVGVTVPAGTAANALPGTGTLSLRSWLATARNCLAWLVGRFNSAGQALVAEKLATARTITLTGDASGSAAFDGTADISINTAVSHATQANHGLVRLSTNDEATSATSSAIAVAPAQIKAAMAQFGLFGNSRSATDTTKTSMNDYVNNGFYVVHPGSAVVSERAFAGAYYFIVINDSYSGQNQIKQIAFDRGGHDILQRYLLSGTWSAWVDPARNILPLSLTNSAEIKGILSAANGGTGMANATAITGSWKSGSFGYMTFSNGLILQWGRAYSLTTVTLNTPFTTTVYTPFTTRLSGASIATISPVISSFTTTSFYIDGRDTNNAEHSAYVSWMAIGY